MIINGGDEHPQLLLSLSAVNEGRGTTLLTGLIGIKPIVLKCFAHY